MTGVAPTLQRTSESFERGNVTRKLEKGSANTPEESKGPYFAEYDVTAPAGGRYQLDVLEQETGSGTADIHINGVLESAGQGAVTNREASPDAGGWSVAGVYELKAGKNVIRLEHKTRYPYFEALHADAVRGRGGAEIRSAGSAAVWRESRLSGSVGGGDAPREGRAAFRAAAAVRLRAEEDSEGRRARGMDLGRRRTIPRL